MAPTAERVKTRGPHAPTGGSKSNSNGHPEQGQGKSANGSTDIRDAGSQIAAAMLEAADPSTGEHSDDVELVVDQICKRLSVNGEDRDDILVAARLHDVGKVAVPREILEKNGPLDDDEWTLIKEHTVTGERILRSVPELVPASVLVRHSHEHFDGSGYPDGLDGEEIPLGSRIILCADAFHAIRSDRPYRKGRPTGAALKEMKRCAGSQFDPKVVEALNASIRSAKRSERRRKTLPPRLAILFAMLAIGTGGAFAAERGWIPSPIPGLGPERASEPDAPGAEQTATITEDGGLTATGDLTGSDDDVAGTDEASGEARGTEQGASTADPAGRRGEGGRAKASGAAGPVADGSAGAQAGGNGQGSGEASQGGGSGGDGAGGGSADGTGGAGGATGTGPASGSAGGSHGNSGSAPGQSGSSPGQSGSSPGQSGSSPGQSGSAPGQSGSAPGQSGSNPGSGGAPPGQSGSAPGQSGSTPGQSGAAPGQSGAAPGQSGTAPGQTGSPGSSATAPGQTGSPGNSGNAPGQGGAGGNPHAT